jgi:hypothetical protein
VKRFPPPCVAQELESLTSPESAKKESLGLHG